MNQHIKDLVDDGFTVTFSKHPDKLGGGWFYLCEVSKQIAADESIEDGFIGRTPKKAVQAAWNRYIGFYKE